MASSAAVLGLETVAFKNPDGSFVLIVVNAAGEARRFTVRFGRRALDYALPAAAVATLRWAN
jgi:glucosylceramidase